MEDADLVGAMVQDFHWRLWRPHHKRLRFLSAPSVKLVYLFLALNGPQNFTTIRRALDLSSRTVDHALKELLSTRFVELDEVYYLYNIVYFSSEEG